MGLFNKNRGKNILYSTKYRVNRILQLISEEGWLILFITLVRNFIGIPCERFYLFRHTIIDRNAEDFMPNIRDFEHFILRDIQEMETLESKGYKFISRGISTKIALNNGVIVFCVFVNKELAHIGRLALTGNAKSYVDNLPFEVDFNRGEACTGGTWTSPKYRGKGLMKYGYYQRFEFLRGLGVKISRNAVNITNIASRRVHEKFNPEIYGEAKSRKLFFIFQFWNEKPLSHPSNQKLAE